MLTRLTGQGVQVNKAVVGRNAFAHEAGIHQDGMLKDRRTYEIMRAEDVGAPWNPLVLGKHSGRHAVQRRCADLGFELEGDELVEVYRALMAIADERKILTDSDIRAVVARVRAEHAGVARRRRSVRYAVGGAAGDPRVGIRPRRLAASWFLGTRTIGIFNSTRRPSRITVTSGRAADAGVRDHPRKMAGIVDRRAVERDHDVARSQCRSDTRVTISTCDRRARPCVSGAPSSSAIRVVSGTY